MCVQDKTSYFNHQQLNANYKIVSLPSFSLLAQLTSGNYDDYNDTNWELFKKKEEDQKIASDTESLKQQSEILSRHLVVQNHFNHEKSSSWSKSEAIGVRNELSRNFFSGTIDYEHLINLKTAQDAILQSNLRPSLPQAIKLEIKLNHSQCFVYVQFFIMLQSSQTKAEELSGSFSTVLESITNQYSSTDFSVIQIRREDENENRFNGIWEKDICGTHCNLAKRLIQQLSSPGTTEAQPTIFMAITTCLDHVPFFSSRISSDHKLCEKEYNKTLAKLKYKEFALRNNLNGPKHKDVVTQLKRVQKQIDTELKKELPLIEFNDSAIQNHDEDDWNFSHPILHQQKNKTAKQKNKTAKQKMKRNKRNS